MKIGDRYNWIGQTKCLIYVGKEGNWHQFEGVDLPGKVWCEVLDCDLHMLEPTSDLHGDNDTEDKKAAIEKEMENLREMLTSVNLELSDGACWVIAAYITGRLNSNSAQ